MSMENNKPSPSLFLVLYIIGALLSFALAIIAAWTDLEAAFYGFSRRASTTLSGLSCPVLLNRNEIGIVSVSIRNTTERKLSPSVRAEFSSRLTPISTLESVQIEPGESKTLEWTVGPENIDLSRFIFSKVLVFASYPMPDREASCGTLIVNLPIPGSVLLFSMTALGLGGMAGGLFALNRSHPLSDRLERILRPLTFLAIMITLALVVGLAGWWVQAVLVLAVTLISIIIVMNYALFR